MYFWKMRKKGKIKCIKKCIGRLGKQRIMEIDCLTESSYILEMNNDVVDIHCFCHSNMQSLSFISYRFLKKIMVFEIHFVFKIKFDF